jgi:hypothetical protein
MPIYASPNGRHFHTNRDCLLLQNGDFERLGYQEIGLDDLKRLNPCLCVYKMYHAKGKDWSPFYFPLVKLARQREKELLVYKNAWLELTSIFGELDRKDDLIMMDKIIKTKEQELKNGS